MSRTAVAEEILTAKPDGWTYRIRDDDAFERRYPFGLAPIPPLAEGDTLDFSPRLIAKAGEHLNDAQFRSFCEGMRTFQYMTIGTFMVKFAPDTTVEAFVADYPEYGALLATVAQHHDVTLVRLLGADRGEGIS